MKKLIIAILILSLSQVFAKNFYQQKNIRFTDDNGQELYYKDRLYIKVKSDVKINLQKDFKTNKINSLNPQLDKIFMKYKIFNIEKTFNQSNNLPNKVKERIQNISSLPDLSKIFTVVTPKTVNLNSFISDLKATGLIEYDEFVPVMYLAEIPNDSLYLQLQHLPQIYAEQAWDVFKGEQSDSTIVIGISDTGTDYTHPDLYDNLWINLREDADGDGKGLEWNDSLKTYVIDPGDLNGIDDDGNGFVDDIIGWDFVNSYEEDTQGNDPMDYHSHGTHVTGLTSGVTNNSIGIASVSWNVKYYPSSHSSPTFKNILRGYEGIVYLAEMGCDVINCSWGGGGYSRTEAEAIAYATSLGAIVVCAAGNNNAYGEFFPAAYPNVISIASVASSNKKASYSNYGKFIDLAAPGGDYAIDGGILSTFLNHSYIRFQGTSMASPVATGLFGLVRAYHPDWSNDEIVRQVLGSADNVDTINANLINMLGYGRINAYRALTEPVSNIPKTLKLQLVDVNINDSLNGNNNKGVEPGEIINFSFLIRNYSQLTGSDNTTITISTKDTNVEIIQSSTNIAFNPDDFTETDFTISVKINENAKSGFVNFTLTAESQDAEILDGVTSSFDIPINAGGILIWDSHPGQRGYSGKFISDFLRSQGYENIYTDKFPISMVGFDAVFLCFGAIADNHTYTSINDWYAEDIINYLKGGGKLYLEAMDAFGWDQRNNKEFLTLFGVDSSADGTSEAHAVDSLFGQPNTIMEGLNFYKLSFNSFQSADQLVAGGTGKAALKEPYTDAVIQNEGEYGQKTVVSVYPMYYLIDRESPNSRYEYIKRVMNFFGLECEYTVPRFLYSPQTGHFPMTVNFTENSYTSLPILSWKWDMEGQGYNDGLTENKVSWVYKTNGDYNPKMTVSNGKTEQTVTNPLYVFDGESAAFFNNNGLALVEDSSMNIQTAFSVEAWIYPHSLGQSSFGRIIDKNKIIFMLDNNKKLRVLLEYNDGSKTDLNTSESSVTFNVWQHVAMTYDGYSNVQIYVNGKQMKLDTVSYSEAKTIADNSTQALVIGNRVNWGRAFHGRIDELRIWSKALTNQQILNRMLTKLKGNETNLELYLTFEEGSGNIANDKTKYKRNAKFNSTSWRQGWHPAHIQKQPENQQVCENQYANFEALVIEAGKKLTYQWYNSSGPLEESDQFIGVNTNYLSVLASKETEGTYYLEIKDEQNNTEKSNVVNLNKIPQPKIIQQPPKEIAFNLGDNIEIDFEVEEENTLSYEWYKNGNSLGINTKKLIIESADNDDVGYYWCEIYNDCGSVQTDTVYLQRLINVEDENNPISFNVHPNPSDGSAIIQINSKNLSNFEIIISDNLSKEIYRQRVNQCSQQIINLSPQNLNSGIYYIRLVNEKFSLTKKLIILK